MGSLMGQLWFVARHWWWSQVHVVIHGLIWSTCGDAMHATAESSFRAKGTANVLVYKDIPQRGVPKSLLPKNGLHFSLQTFFHDE